MNVWLHPDAEAELGDAAVHYATHANRAVAEAFLAEYESARDRVAENPQRGPHAGQGLRLFHFDRFPYTLIYDHDAAGGVRIFAVAHQRREPGYWQARERGTP